MERFPKTTHPNVLATARPVGSTRHSAYADEILICEGGLIGKTREQLRSLHFRRDRDWLQS